MLLAFCWSSSVGSGFASLWAAEVQSGLQADGTVDNGDEDDPFIIFEVLVYQPSGITATGQGTNTLIAVVPISKQEFVSAPKYSSNGNWYQHINGTTRFYIGLDPVEDIVYTSNSSNTLVYRRVLNDFLNSNTYKATIQFYQGINEPIVDGNFQTALVSSLTNWFLAGIGIAASLFIVYFGFGRFFRYV